MFHKIKFPLKFSTVNGYSAFQCSSPREQDPVCGLALAHETHLEWKTRLVVTIKVRGVDGFETYLCRKTNSIKWIIG